MWPSFIRSLLDYMSTGRHQISLHSSNRDNAPFCYCQNKTFFDFATSTINCHCYTYLKVRLVSFSSSLSGRCTLQLRLISKNCEKAKVTKNRSVMVVSDHNRPVLFNGIALLGYKIYFQALMCVQTK